MSAESSTAQVLARRDDKYETETTRLSTSAPPLGRRGEAAGALRAEAADFERRELDSSGTCSTKRQVRDGDDKVAVNSAARLPRSGCWSSERAEAADFVFRFSTPALVQCTGWSEKLLHGANELVPVKVEAAGALGAEAAAAVLVLVPVPQLWTGTTSRRR